MSNSARFDLVVIGAGPAGQKAAVQGAKAGASVAVVEQLRDVGGACVHTGTIPSKALREYALLRLAAARSRELDMSAAEPQADDNFQVPLGTLLRGVQDVIAAHDRFMADQLRRNAVTVVRGRAQLVACDQVDVTGLNGQHTRLQARRIVIATGSRPRAPQGLAPDHEHILDSDSILSLTYLPRSLLVIGGGVIACEYASMFASLGCKVTQLDRHERPLGFIDAELTDYYLGSLAQHASCFLPAAQAVELRRDGPASVLARLDDGRELRADKALVAQGRRANVEALGLDALGIKLNAHGFITVNGELATSVAGIYAAGDVIGPPSLASAAMEQGRRAACHALGLAPGESTEVIPTGVYTIPEIASVGLSEGEARAHFGAALVGRARFDEVARGQIAGAQQGLLKLVADAGGRKVLGAQIVGNGAADLVHLAQLGLAADLDVNAYVENIFNFPTMAEAYRVAALDIAKQRAAASQPSDALEAAASVL
ncbi:MAG: Si-specific NAD(P)(+) transhydrogenase [Steroidobacteraceae bacterium]